MSKRIVIGAVAVLVLGAFFFLVRDGGLDVTVAVATRDSMSVTIPAEGMTRARERFTVTAPVNGRITRLDLEEGDLVEEGRLIARLFPTPQDPRVIATLRSEVDAAAARYRQAQTRLREAELQESQTQRELERRRPLAEMGAITKEAMEQVELAATVAEERREGAEADVESARATLESARAGLLGAASDEDDSVPIEVRAPVAGRVMSVLDASARVVATGAPLLTLADVGGLEIVMDILSEDAVRVEPGDEIVVTGWGGDQTLTGEVRRVTLVGYTKVSALGVEEQRVDVISDLHHRPPSLGIGYRLSGDIVVWRGEDVLTVPTGALFRIGDSWHVFVVEDGRAGLRKVGVGHQNEDATEVVEGLAEGEPVILFPPAELEEGDHVRGEALPT